MKPSLLAELARGVWETIRETLPSPKDEREMTTFIAGLAYGLLIYVALLLVISWATLTAVGGR